MLLITYSRLVSNHRVQYEAGGGCPTWMIALKAFTLPDVKIRVPDPSSVLHNTVRGATIAPKATNCLLRHRITSVRG